MDTTAFKTFSSGISQWFSVQILCIMEYFMAFKQERWYKIHFYELSHNLIEQLEIDVG